MAATLGQSGAGIPLLETKLHLPRRRPGLIPRPRLIARLEQGAARKLTLVAAPAGFGKTTLLADWLAASAGERAAAWVSLDRSDNDPALFWAYVVGALQKIEPRVGANALSMLHSPQPPPIEPVLTTLINDLTTIERDVSLVLDDFHVIDAEPVQRGAAFLLDHQPPRLHLVIASRTDPPLPLARLRARDDATELGAADLRFTLDEAAAFLNQAMGLNLSAESVATLESRTEGWIAGLQLAALSLQRRENVAGFIASFAGDDRYIVDYLIEEVLQHQPGNVRRFLLQTALLERLCGSLCDAVTGGDDGAAVLESLERDNLFVVPLDTKRHWYRYHHLFADVLQAHAAAEQPDQVAVRHRRASAWFEQRGLHADAVRHALAAGDVGRAATLVESAALGLLGSSQEETLHGWLRALPDEVLRARPVLSVYGAFASFGRGHFESAAARLQDAERWLEPAATEGGRSDAPPVEMVVVDEVAFRSLPGMIAVARAYLAGAGGDMDGVVSHARRAVDLLPEADNLWRGAAAALLGIACWTNGELEAAYRGFAHGMAQLQAAGHVRFEIGCAYILADIRVAQGRLREAFLVYEHALRLAMEQAEPVWGTADLYVGLSALHCERNDLDAASRQLATSKELGEHAGLPETRHRWYVAKARIQEARGDLNGALALLDEAERRQSLGTDPDVRPVAALKARLWVAQGRLAEALGWARARNLAVDDDLSYLREFEHMTLARVLIARFRNERDHRAMREAERLLERLLAAAEEGERPGSVIEILLLQALAHEARGDIVRALALLERALALAEPEGYVRTFVGEGEPMRALLRRAAAEVAPGAYARRLLAAFDQPARPDSPPAQNAASALAEPLTAREIEILRLIAAGMKNQQIADHLFISQATVKRHIANAYGKLAVGHRTEAIARANELNLL